MVVGATGHQNLPRSATATIASRIRDELTGIKGLEGICSLAAGADQLFAKLVLETGGKLRVVVPSHHYESAFEHAEDRRAFYELLRRAASVEELEYAEPSEAAFFAAGRRVVDRSDRVIAIWDGLPARGFGGTADVVRYARNFGKEVVIIWPDRLIR